MHLTHAAAQHPQHAQHAPDLLVMQPLLGQLDELPPQGALPIPLGSEPGGAAGGSLQQLLQRPPAQLLRKVLSATGGACRLLQMWRIGLEGRAGGHASGKGLQLHGADAAHPGLQGGMKPTYNGDSAPPIITSPLFGVRVQLPTPATCPCNCAGNHSLR